MSKTDMHRAEIVARVKIATGLSLKKLSILNGLNEQACKQALNRPYKEPEIAISKAIGLPVQLIWPSRYHIDGSRIKGLHSHKQNSIANQSLMYTNVAKG